MDFAIVTLHYKNLPDTLALLESLSQAKLVKGLDFKVYVIDNESSADLKVAIKKYSKAILINSGSNLGFSAGNNLGLKQAIADGYQYLICLNNDTLVPPDFFTKLSQSPIDDPKIGAIGGLIYFAPGYEYRKFYSKKDLGKVIWYAGGAFDWANVLGSNAHVDEVDGGQFTKVTDTAFVTGAFFLTKAEVLQKAGFFDENYFMYLEDVDLSHRIRLAGLRVVFDPSLKIWHKVAQSSQIGSSLNDYFITRNRLLFGFKFLSLRTKFALLRESFKKLLVGTKAQKTAVLDFYRLKFGKGSWIKS